MMTRIYEIWLNEKTTIREAFNRTQLEINAKYPKPYYWGAFILVGE
jgi:CHAT domain-containing protein